MTSEDLSAFIGVHRRPMMFCSISGILLVIGALLCGCSRSLAIRVGSKNFTEQLILGEIAAQHLERRLGVAVDRRLNLGGTLLAHQALASGQIDVLPEYT